MARVRAADAVVVGSPNYHGSYASPVRDFHDYCGFDEYEDDVADRVDSLAEAVVEAARRRQLADDVVGASADD